jgi:hypothetical protein
MGFGREVQDFLGAAKQVYTTYGEQKYKDAMGQYNSAEARTKNVAIAQEIAKAAGNAKAMGETSPYDNLDANGNIKPDSGASQQTPGLWSRLKTSVFGSGGSGATGGSPGSTPTVPASQMGIPMPATGSPTGAAPGQPPATPTMGLPIGNSATAPGNQTPGYADGGLVTPQPVAPPSNNPTAYTPPPDQPQQPPAPAAPAASPAQGGQTQQPAATPQPAPQPGAAPPAPDFSMDPVAQGIKYLQRTFGLDRPDARQTATAQPTQAPAPQQMMGLPIDTPPAPQAPVRPVGVPVPNPGKNGGLRALLTGVGAEDNQNVKLLTQAVDPHNTMTEGQRLFQGIEATAHFYTLIGQPEKAAAATASLIQNYRQNMTLYGTQAVAAANAGDWKTAAALMQKSYDYVPDGFTAKVTPTANGIAVQRFDMQGQPAGGVTQMTGATAIRDLVGSSMDFDKWAQHVLSERTQAEVQRHNQAQEGIEGGRNAVMAGDLALRQQEATFNQGNIAADRQSGAGLSAAYAGVSKATQDLADAQASGDQDQVRQAQAALSAAKDAQFAAERQAQPGQINTMSGVDARNQSLALRGQQVGAQVEHEKAQQALAAAQTDLAVARTAYQNNRTPALAQQLAIKQQMADAATVRANAAAARAGVTRTAAGAGGFKDQAERDQAYETILTTPEVKSLIDQDTSSGTTHYGEGAANIAMSIMQSQPQGVAAPLAAKAAAGVVGGSPAWKFDQASQSIIGPGVRLALRDDTAAAVQQAIAARVVATTPPTRAGSGNLIADVYNAMKTPGSNLSPRGRLNQAPSSPTPAAPQVWSRQRGYQPAPAAPQVGLPLGSSVPPPSPPPYTPAPGDYSSWSRIQWAKAHPGQPYPGDVNVGGMPPAEGRQMGLPVR